MDKIWKFGLFIWLLLVIIGAFVWAPVDPILKEFTRILYFHVPTAWITVLAFLIGAVSSILYLKKRDLIYDYTAEATNQIGFMFCVLATVGSARREGRALAWLSFACGFEYGPSSRPRPGSNVRFWPICTAPARQRGWGCSID